MFKRNTRYAYCEIDDQKNSLLVHRTNEQISYPLFLQAVLDKSDGSIQETDIEAESVTSEKTLLPRSRLNWELQYF